VKISFLLDLYQPEPTEEHIFRKVTEECYIPLLKFLKIHKGLNFTLNTPLSLLEQMDKYGYSDWLRTLKELYTAEEIDVIGSAAYHPFLTTIPQELVEEQIVLNEYGVGYYLGSHKDFEGNPAIQIRNMRGFLSPEGDIDDKVVGVLDDFGYEWVVVPSDKSSDHPYILKDYKTLIICQSDSTEDLIASVSDAHKEELTIRIDTITNKICPCIFLSNEFLSKAPTGKIHALKEFIDLLDSLGVSYFKLNDLITFKGSEVVNNSSNILKAPLVCRNAQVSNIVPKDKLDNPLQSMVSRADQVLIQNYLTYLKAQENSTNPLKSKKVLTNTQVVSKDANENIGENIILDNDESTISIFINKLLLSDKYKWVNSALEDTKESINKLDSLITSFKDLDTYLGTQNIAMDVKEPLNIFEDIKKRLYSS